MPGVSIDLLVRVPLFADLDDGELRLLADSMWELSYEPGEVVTSEGDPADGFFIVESGMPRA